MDDHIQENFLDLRNEVFGLLRDTSQNDPNRRIVGILFDRMECSVKEIDNERRLRNHVQGVLTDAEKTGTTFLSTFDKRVEKIKKQITEARIEGSLEDALLALFEEVREDIELLTDTFLEVKQAMK